MVHKFKAREAREAKKNPTPPSSIVADQGEAESVSPSPSLEIVKQDDFPLSVRYALTPTIEDRATSLFVFRKEHCDSIYALFLMFQELADMSLEQNADCSWIIFKK